ncbi:hypothetical protein BpHYR1_047463 [Brachionus plicatilis]|uniref:Uncharacterized protein n=1 Tax=Brachionus plicatilis TaxID=10195 RepID=A0A3M7QPJ1_BRAPC|nr:hypothetical protein BpHYR1_047463 [Brachionus plicatilis]
MLTRFYAKRYTYSYYYLFNCFIFHSICTLKRIKKCLACNSICFNQPPILLNSYFFESRFGVEKHHLNSVHIL